MWIKSSTRKSRRQSSMSKNMSLAAKMRFCDVKRVMGDFCSLSLASGEGEDDLGPKEVRIHSSRSCTYHIENHNSTKLGRLDKTRELYPFL